MLQAQQYPSSWTGYISHNGFISPDKTDKFGRSDLNNVMQVDPRLLENPVLILGNAHDNNVNMRHWTHFYKKAKEAQKQHLIKSWFTYTGISLEKNDNMWETGHFTPDSAEQFFDYANIMLNFVTKGKITHDEKLSEYTNLIGWIKSYENYPSASAEKLFLAEAYKQEYEGDNAHHLTDEDLRKLFNTLYVIKYKCDSLKNSIEKAKEFNLQRGFRHDYVAWVHFVNDLMDEDGTSVMKLDLNIDFSTDLLNIYKKALLNMLTYKEKNPLIFLRSMRSFFVENHELLPNSFEENNEDFKIKYEEAKSKWEKFKEEKKALYKKVAHFYDDKNRLLLSKESNKFISLDRIEEFEDTGSAWLCSIL